MTEWAGAALSMPNNVGRLCYWHDWKPTSQTCGWLLLAGACEPPSNVDISSRKENAAKSGDYLTGVGYDFTSMEKLIINESSFELVDTFRSLHATRAEAKQKIEFMLQKCATKKWKPCIYYTGHGECGSGDWCFSDGKLSFEELFNIAEPIGDFRPLIVSDCCFSGVWANDCRIKGKGGLYCLAACSEFETAIDHRFKGGSMTLWSTQKDKPDGITGQFPATCPLWSGRSYQDYKFPTGYGSISFVDFFSSQMKGKFGKYSCAAMSVTGTGRMTALFVQENNPVRHWAVRASLNGFQEFVSEKWNQCFRLRHAEGFGEKSTYYMYFEKGFGKTQSWFGQSTVDGLKEKIQKGYDDNKRITTCFADGTFIYCVMTEDAPEFQLNAQTWFLKNKWSDIAADIRKGYDDGKILTALTYLTKTKQYFGVMTLSTRGQSYSWKDGEDLVQWRNGYTTDYKITINFRDPEDGKTLTVITSGYPTGRSYSLWQIRA